MSDKILTLHPQGKQGVNIDQRKYEAIKAAILNAIGAAGQLPFSELPAVVERNLEAPFNGSIGWYTTTVKLDLEARGLIERLPDVAPQVLRLKS
jgi:hypothetical protein